jgi:hypothetical protein
MFVYFFPPPFILVFPPILKNQISAAINLLISALGHIQVSALNVNIFPVLSISLFQCLLPIARIFPHFNLLFLKKESDAYEIMLSVHLCFCPNQ